METKQMYPITPLIPVCNPSITVPAWDPIKKQMSTMMIYHHQFYQVIYETGYSKYGWINTDESLIKKIHEEAKITSAVTELLPMDFVWNPKTERIEGEGCILDLVNEVKHIIPIKFFSKVNNKRCVGDHITIKNNRLANRFLLYPKYPVAIKSINGENFIGQVESTVSTIKETKKKSFFQFFHRKRTKEKHTDILMVRPITEYHPDGSLIPIHVDGIEAIDHIQINIEGGK